MWIGTQEDGISLYSYETDDFKSWSNTGDNNRVISDNNVLAISEDYKGTIWAGTHNGRLNYFDETSGTFVRIRFKNSLPEGFSLERINSMFFENDSILWMGAYTGLFIYNIRQQEITPVYADGKFIDNWITCLYNENGRIIWLGTKSGLIKYDKLKKKSEHFKVAGNDLSSELITDIRATSDGYILIATDGGGLNLLDTATGEISVYMSDPNNINSLSNNSLYKIFIDSYGALWIGNYAGGINYYSKFDWKFRPVRHELNNRESLSDNHVRTFFEDREGKIWIGTLGGFNEYNPLSKRIKAYTFNKSKRNDLNTNSVLSFYEDPHKLLWIGTFGGGISLFDKQKHTFKKYTHPHDKTNSLEKASIYNMLDIGNNKLCIASLGGIYLIDLNSGSLKRYTSSNSGLSNNTVKALCLDRHGNIWIGTNKGLNKFNPSKETFEVFRHSIENVNSLSNNRVLCITESRDGKIWIGTEGGGVSIYDSQHGGFSSVTVENGLPDDVINSIVQDDQGQFWLTTNKGLVKYDEKKKKALCYTAVNGLQGNEFYQNSVLKAKNGDIYMGGPYGFNTFTPRTLVYNTRVPKIIITDLYLSGKLVRVSDSESPLKKQLPLLRSFRLPFKSNFEIHFSALGVGSKGKYLCSYYMDGFGEQWTDFLNIRSANFANLAPGKYTFMVRAMNNDGISSEKNASIEIIIMPPWWKTWWAFLIYALIIGFLLWLFIRINNLKIKAKHELHVKIKEKEQIEELNSLKLKFFTDISHEFKTPLTLILAYLDNLKQVTTHKKEETMSGIEKNAKRLLKLINQLLEFRKAESGLMKLKVSNGDIIQMLSSIKENFDELASVKNISFELNCTNKITDLWFDSEKIEKIIFNLLSNAFKATPEGGEIGINVEKNQGFITISIIDTGRGIDPAEINRIFDLFYQSREQDDRITGIENSGIGLAYCKSLVELHHGEIAVKSEIGKGTTFFVKLPLGRDHLRNFEIKENGEFELRMDYQSLTNELIDADDVFTELQSAETKLPILLIVDDNSEVCKVLSDKFRASYYVLTALNGEAGFKKAFRYLPDMVISDVLMPVMDGYALCNNLKTNLMTCHIPVILLTAKSGEENQINGYASGADAYISKPYNPDLLKATVETLLKNRQLLRKKFIQQSEIVPAEIIDNKLDEEFLTKIIARVEDEKFSENIDVASLCRELAMSRSVLYRKIKMITGNSIQEFVRTVKLRKASRMLLDSSTPISSIAYSAGFNNTKHFSTAFKKMYGKTPSQYRS